MTKSKDFVCQKKKRKCEDVESGQGQNLKIAKSKERIIQRGENSKMLKSKDVIKQKDENPKVSELKAVKMPKSEGVKIQRCQNP